MIVDKLIKYAVEKAAGQAVKDVRAGLGYTCVMLDDHACGLAYTFRNELGQCCELLSDAGTMIGTEAKSIIPWVKSENRLKAAVGLAAINALLNDPQKEWETGNVISALNLAPSDHFGMIGAFGPILSEVEKTTSNIYVFEQNISKGRGLYSSEMIPKYLPKCDVVMVTATSLINHTFDDVIRYCDHARDVFMVGPSTPLCPDVFRDYHITVLAGSVVAKPALILPIVSQGGGTRSMKPAIKQVLVRA